MSGFIRRGKERGKENEVSKRGAKHIDDNAHKAKTLIRGFIKFCVCFALQRQADICIEKFIVRFGHILFVHAKQSVTMAVQVIVVLCLNDFPIIRAFLPMALWYGYSALIFLISVRYLVFSSRTATQSLIPW